MGRLRGKLISCLGAAAVAAGSLALAPVSVEASNGATTCSGGPIAGGTYANLVVAGPCLLAAGDVTVTKNLTIEPGTALYAMFGGSNLKVEGNLAVGSGAVLILGCEPEAFPCSNGSSLTTDDTIGGNLDAQDALAVIAHHDIIDGNLTLHAGGGGYNCDPQPLLFGIAPAYATFEDDTIKGQASVTDWTSCWLGLFRDKFMRTVTFNYNDTFLVEDTNEISGNSITVDLNCVGNAPPPHADMANTVGGKATGQCAGLT